MTGGVQPAAVIRAATPEDLPVLMELERASHAAPWASGSMRREFERSDGVRLIAEIVGDNDQRIAGFLFAAPIGDAWHVLDIVVAPNARRRGVGLALMRAFLATVDSARADCTLEVRASNAAAVALYERVGFTSSGRRLRYYPDGEDAVIMWRRATPTILAIESSCDETCAAVVRGGTVLSSIVASQVKLHERFGGVVPEIASRRHLEYMDAVISEALTDAGIERPDAVAVTQGPGLVGALLVGVAAAKARAYAWGVPLIAVDHLVGHVASAMLSDDDVAPPFLCVVASGGHTLVLDVDERLAIELLGTTRDDAAGEAFDKGARLLGLGLPGGPAIEKLADAGDADAIAFTPAMVHHDTLDMSFSGVKTALASELAGRGGLSALDTDALADVAASYQHAIVQTITGSVRKLLQRRGPKSGHEHARGRLALVGGVAANSMLRRRIVELCAESDVEMSLVPLKYCADNAAMIGVAAPYFRSCKGVEMRTLDAFASSTLFRLGTLVPMELA